MRLILTTLILLFGAGLQAEEISYRITQEEVLHLKKKLIAEGARTYMPLEIGIKKRDGFSSKSLEIAHGFSLGASIYRDKKDRGFGLWIEKDGGGFSWEWFDHEQGNIYKKRQEGGKIKVEFRHLDELKEIQSIEFLDDISMRLNALHRVQREKTHRILIKKGSKLVLPASIDEYETQLQLALEQWQSLKDDSEYMDYLYKANDFHNQNKLHKKGNCQNLKGRYAVGLIVMINREGLAEQVFTSVSGKKANCYRSSYLNVQFPKPSVAPFYFRIIQG